MPTFCPGRIVIEISWRAALEELGYISSANGFLGRNSILVSCSDAFDFNKTFGRPINRWFGIFAFFCFHFSVGLEVSQSGNSPKRSLEYCPSTNKRADTQIESCFIMLALIKEPVLLTYKEHYSSRHQGILDL
jgi:hypothetical protein